MIDKSAYRRNVGIMLLDRDNQVFVGHRMDERRPAWQMPQGGIDRGENPRQAALRELAEETGITAVEVIAKSRDWLHYDLPPAVAARKWGGRYRGQRQKWFVMRFLGDDGDIDIATPHPEFRAWKWIAPSDLPKVVVAFKRPVYEALLAEFRDFLEGQPAVP